MSHLSIDCLITTEYHVKFFCACRAMESTDLQRSMEPMLMDTHPIYTPDSWSEGGGEYKLGTKGLLAW